MMNRRAGILLWMAALVPMAAVWAAGNGGGQPTPQPHYGDVAQKVARVLPTAHLLQYPLDDVISQKAWTNLITAFDFDRSYFLQSDIAAFTNMQTRIDDAVKAGDVSFPFEVYRVFRTRLEDRYVYVTNLLSADFSFNEDESYTWKRKDAPWPATQAEQDELWRKRIKNEVLVQMIGRELDQAAATNTVAAATNPYTVSTNGMPTAVASGGTATNTPPVLTPQENVAKRYKQFLIVIQDMDEEAILQRYLSAVAMAYDPHSDYMSPMRKEDFDIDMNLSLCGIGAQLRSEDGTAMVMEVIPGGPADRDKRAIRLTKGDKIIGVGQGDGAIEDIVHLPLNKAVRKIRGEKGTKVVLSVIPASDPSGTTTKIVDLIRDEVKLEEQAATGRVARVTLPDGTVRKLGLVKLPTFYGTMDKRPNQPGFRSATVDVAKQLAAFNSENVAGLILDLRNNGGGSLREAVSLTGLFVRSGPVVQVREARQIVVLPVPNMDPAMAFRKPMVVLINRASASASEIVAGALQDYGRAVLVGDTQSHGKGTVQTVMPLGSEKFGSMKVTTASFYRINGASTQRKGVAADIVIPSTLDGLDIGEDKLPGALPWTQIEQALYIPVSDVAKFVPQLKERSAKRLAENSRYVRYCTLVRHVQEVNEKKEVPLEINARRKLMKAENEMRKLEDEEEDASKAHGDKEDDVVLEEALNILSDLVTLTGGTDIPMETEGDLRTRMMRIFGHDLP
ncbi:MAG TPA: carboxy terminal-processing peptidase [Kiritimatiellia bacterium]|nr:carboxy terminal-processing peptidase [Kiritimatiellia bacterium]HRU71276.1 carboxy terminal-processing peptidase [Kiritimatiellia bacterium]